jgi:hypothetical protein
MRLLVTIAALISALAFAGAASASQLITRDATNVSLAVNTKGEALVSFKAQGRAWHVLAWGAVNAKFPNEESPQVRFKLDYSGGWGTYHKVYWKGFANGCKAYTGPSLPNVLATCTAPDSSWWVLQKFQMSLPDLGFVPWTPALRATELHLSHWTGPVAEIEVHTDWVYSGRFHSLFGRLTYLNKPVYGFKTNSVGAPLDKYGRLIFLDTFNSKYGPGWRRENSFVAHNPTGFFCYGFYTFDPPKDGYIHPPGETAMRGPGNGEKYRLTVEGPGVTPIVSVVFPALHDYNAGSAEDVLYERQQNALLDSIIGEDKLCRQH